MVNRLYNELRDELEQFFNNYYRDELEELWEKYPSEKSDVWVDYTDIVRWNPEIADIIIGEKDGYSFGDVEEAFSNIVADLDGPVPCDIEPERLDIRVYNLSGAHTYEVGGYWAEDLGEYRSIEGQISKATPVSPDFEELAYECQRCGVLTYVPQDNDNQEPHECRSCERQGPFNVDFDESIATDYQLLRLEQPPEEVHSESANDGASIDVRIEGSLAKWLSNNNVTSGARVTISGMLTTELDDDGPNSWILEAHAIEVEEEQLQEPEPEDKEFIRELANGEHGDPFVLLCKSIAPSLYGTDVIEDVTYNGEERTKLWWIKGSTALATLFQGWRRPNGDGTFQRGTTHVLYMGDPSTGKSTLMQAIENISPISASTSGKGATAAGLTAAATKSDAFAGDQWSLEAGVLVKAHGGVACVDEIDKMDSSAVNSMHSALEKQLIDFNKAGMEATLPCETSLLASGNPKHSRFDRYESDMEQFDLVGSLLDRFGLIWTLKDIPDVEQDRKKAGHIIQSRTESGLVDRGELTESETDAIDPAIEQETLRKWVALSRNYKPVIQSDDVADRIKDFYAEIRSSSNGEDNDDIVPATTRNVMDILRLAEASARLRLSNEITIHDAETAIAAVQASLLDIGYDPESGTIDVDLADGNMSHSQRDRKGRLKGIVSELEGESSGADLEEVLDLAESAGIEREQAEREIETLKQRQKSGIYEPKRGELRTV